MNKTCARCEKTVYPTEELKCLDKVWHKGCFKCQECGMTLNMRTYKGYGKLPYCESHVPKAKHTTMAETPELKRIAENTKIQSNVKYHADFERSKGKFTQVADDPETLRIKANTRIISNVAYHGDLEKKAHMERQRQINENGELVEVPNDNYHQQIDTYTTDMLPTVPPPNLPPKTHYQTPTTQYQNRYTDQRQYKPEQMSQPQYKVDQNAQPQYKVEQNAQQYKVEHQTHYKPEHNSQQYKPEQQNSQHYKPEQQNSQHYKAEQQNSQHYKAEQQNSQHYKPEQQNSQHYKAEQQNSQHYKAEQQNSQHYKAEQQNYKLEQHYKPEPPQQYQDQYYRQQKYEDYYQQYPKYEEFQQNPSQNQNQNQNQNQYYGQNFAQNYGVGTGPKIGRIQDYDPVSDGPRVPPNTQRASSTLIYNSTSDGKRGALQPQQQASRQIGRVADLDPLATEPPRSPANHHNQRVYVAMYDYEANDSDEVSFREGDLISNVTSIDEGWMTGQVLRTGRTGMLPANYVELSTN